MRCVIGSVFAIAIAIAQSSSAAPPPGTLDPTFDGTGIVTTVIGTSTATGLALATQSDGKTVVAGTSDSSCLVARYTIAGALDTAFGGTGYVAVKPDGRACKATAITIAPNGRIVVAALLTISIGTINPEAIALFRLLADGTLDSSFNGTGLVVGLPTQNHFLPNALAVQSDGKLVVGLGWGVDTSSVGLDFALLRYNVNGTLDTGFGASGTVMTDFGANSPDELLSIALQPDGKVLAVGTAGGQSALARYDVNGALDPTFGTGGKAVNAQPAECAPTSTIALQPDGRIVGAGPATDDFVLGPGVCVHRYSTAGVREAAFGGIALRPVTPTTIVGRPSLAIMTGGKFIVSQDATDATNALIVRYRFGVDGSPDLSLGGTGYAITSLGSNTMSYPDATIVDAVGVVTATGGTSSASPHDLLAARLDSSGVLDPAFGGTGRVVTMIALGERAANDVALQTDGKIIAVAGNREFALVRYNGDGTLDPSFAGTGKTIVTPGDRASATAVALQANGRIVVAGSVFNAGTNRTDIALARFNANATLDASFGSGGIVVTPLGAVGSSAQSVAIQADGRIVVGATIVQALFNEDPFNFQFPASDIALVRYNADGSLDSAFGLSGVATVFTGLSYAGRIAIQVDGRIVVSGSSCAMHPLIPEGFPVICDFALARYTSVGAPDASFGSGGKLTTPMLANDDRAYAVGLYADGRVVAAGSVSTRPDIDPISEAPYAIGVTRYVATGAPDSALAGTGKVVSSPVANAFDQHANALALQPDGKIVVAGPYSGPFPSVGSSALEVVRFNSNGSLDTTFNGTGYALVDLSAGAFETANALALQPDGRIVVAGVGHTSRLTVGRLIGDLATPDAFAFASQSGVPLSTPIVSNAVTVTGTNVPVPISVSGGDYCISSAANCACDVRAFASAPAAIAPSQSACVRHTSAATFATTMTTTLTIGGVAAAFSSTTTAASTTVTGANPAGPGSISATIVAGGSASCAFMSGQFIPSTGAASPPPAGVAFPFGLFAFSLGPSCPIGGTVSVAITYPSPLPPQTSYWKYGPTPAQPASHWYEYPATIGAHTIVLTLRDGDVGDDDRTANGVIVDQGGPGVVATIPVVERPLAIALGLLLFAIGARALGRRVSRACS